MDGDRIDWERLERFILGKGSPDERALLEHWVNADPERRALADAMRTVGGSADSRRWDAPRALRHVRRQLGIGGRDVPLIIVAPSKRRRALRRVFVVTGAAAAVVLGVLWRNLSDSQAQRSVVPSRVWATAWTR